MVYDHTGGRTLKHVLGLTDDEIQNGFVVDSNSNNNADGSSGCEEEEEEEDTEESLEADDIERVDIIQVESIEGGPSSSSNDDVIITVPTSPF
jgi:hypothetical protein